MASSIRAYKNIPKGIWALGFVSMFMDISSEMIHGLLPVFLVTVLGASATSVGLIEGVGEGIALVVKVFSGTLSDWVGKRKAIIVVGYLMAALTKPLFAIASGIELVFSARFLDRVGKGIRGAPRDALISELAGPQQRGAAFGLRQSLDSVGAFVGPLLAIALMGLFANDFRTVFWIACVPAVIAVLLLIRFVQEPPIKTPVVTHQAFSLRYFSRLSTAYWMVLSIAVVFTLARFSEAFLLLRAQELGFALHWIPLVLVVMSLFYALGAYPAGHFSDRVGRVIPLVIGLVLLVFADLVLALATNVVMVLVGAAIWGLHMAFTQGLFAALVTDTSDSALRGTAFGCYGLATGIAVFVASVLAGLLWDHLGAAFTFYAGAVFSIFALGGFLLLRYKNLIPR